MLKLRLIINKQYFAWTLKYCLLWFINTSKTNLWTMLPPRADYLMISGNKTYRLLAGQPSVYLTVPICSSTFLAWKRLTKLCAISPCEDLLCITKTIMTKYD